MRPREIIIDCDPGVDDAVALLLAFAAGDALEILGVTTVAGNVSASLTARNACIMREIAGAERVPVFAGATRPLRREPIEAGHFHGASGLGSLPLRSPRVGPSDRDAVEFLVATLTKATQPVTLVAMGPLTNIALALQRDARVTAGICAIVLMGGARREGGNITASAEYNIYADPHAAEVVFACGRPIVAIGLDATHQVLTTPTRIHAIRAIGNAVANAAAELLQFTYDLEHNSHVGGGVPCHDPCTIAYLLQPTAFALQPASIAIETESALTLGHTAVELRIGATHPANARWATAADGAAVFALLTQRLGAR
jgi:purine nucleosidase